MLGLVVLSFAGYTSYRYQRHNLDGLHKTSDQHLAGRDHQLRSACRILPLSLTIECASQPDISEGVQAAAEYDLKAQQDMAAWTLMMLWVSVAMLVVTGLGVWYVARTLDATRGALRLAEEANEAAIAAVEATIEHGHRQLRPYLSAIPTRAVFEVTGSGIPISQKFGLRVIIEVHNTGQTPAFRKRLRGNIRVVAKDAIAGTKIQLPPLTAFGPPTMLGPNRDTESDNLSRVIAVDDAMLNGECEILVYGQIVYESDYACHYSNFCSVSINLKKAILDAQAISEAGKKSASMPPVQLVGLDFGNDAI